MSTLDDLTNGRTDQVSLLGLQVNSGTLRASLIAAGVVIGLGLLVRRRMTSKRPGRAQLLWETLTATVDRRVQSTTGRSGSAIVSLAIALFGFILVANALRIIPGTSALLPTPTADLNLTAALAIAVVVTVHAASLRARGLRGYLQHYLKPYWWLAPINILEELIRPFTLALRLFGTAFAGGLVTALIGELIPSSLAPVPHALWALFDLAIGLLQAFIFALLAILYYESAVGERDKSASVPPVPSPA